MLHPLLRQVYETASTVSYNSYQITIDEFGDQVPAMRPEVLIAATEAVRDIGSFAGNKILTEEDKGAPLGTALSLSTGLPLAMARWYPYHLPGETPLAIKSEYFTGSLYLNGIDAGDQVTIVEDAISTGGTLSALIDGVRARGATVIEALALVEKLDYGGRDAVRSRCGIEVRTVFGIRVAGGQVQVVEFSDCSRRT